MTSQLAKIEIYPSEPIEFFEQIIASVSPEAITMNLATNDEEFGVLNRTVIYRGLMDVGDGDNQNAGVLYVTQNYTRNCKNLQANPKACITFYFPQLQTSSEESPDNWQIRLLGAKAIQLTNEKHHKKLSELWAEEPLHAKIRAHVCDCGKPVNYEDLAKAHDEFYENHVLNESSTLLKEHPDTYTAFKLVPERWDFYKSKSNIIADRVQYRKESNDGGSWQVMHVAT